jgi:hypothetical protein
MTSENDPDDTREEALIALFEKTATAPTDLERARLLAHAAEIAESRVRARRLRLRVVWPAALAAAAAVAYLVVAPPPGGEPPAAAPVAVLYPTIPVVESAGPGAPAISPSREAVAALPEAEDPVALLLGDEPGGSEADLGLLMGTEDPEGEL